MNLPDRTLSVVGARFDPARHEELAICEPGEWIELRPEPRNKADPLAIAVYSRRGVQLGYLRADDAPRIGQLMRQGDVHAVFQQRTNWGGFIRVAFDGNIPDLPPLAEAKGESDFWPDPEWPDD